MMLPELPSWLPLRVRDPWDQRRVLRALRGLERTRPVAAARPSEADAEVQVLLRGRDVPAAILSLKTLLRFGRGRLAVTLTDDGSITPQDRDRLDRHVPDCRWLPRFSDDARVSEALEARPHLRRLYRSAFHLSAKLLHPIVLSRLDRVILLDADTAFFQEPQQLLRWARGEEPAALYLHDVPEKEETVPERIRVAFREVAEVMPEDAGWTLEYFYFNSGLLAYHPGQCRLDRAEAFLEWRAARSVDLDRMDIWFGDWTREQTCYLAMFAGMDPTPRPLDSDYRLAGEPFGVFNHFMRRAMVRSSTLRRLESLVEELG